MKKLFLGLLLILLLAAGCGPTLGSRQTNVASFDKLANSTSPSTVEQKRQCEKDGSEWFATNVEAQTSPQAIYKNNVQYGDSAKPGTVVTSDTAGSPEYTFNTKLNTCLVEYSELVMYKDGSSSTEDKIVDIYSNKTLDDYSRIIGTPNGSKDVQGVSTEFSKKKNDLFGTQN